MNYKTDGERFAVIMYGLADNFGAELSKPGLKMRFEALKALSIEQVDQVAMKILATKKYRSMPTVAEFLEYLQPAQSLGMNSRAQIEADKIISHLKQYGASMWPKLSDPITRHLMTHRWPYGRWASTVLESEIKWWVKEFIEAYKAYKENGGQELLEAPVEIKQLTEGIGTHG